MPVPPSEPSARCPECGEPIDPGAPKDDTRARRRLASPFNPFKWLATVHGATLVAVATAFLLAMGPPTATATGIGAGAQGPSVVMYGWGHWADVLQRWLANGGKGGLLLWPLFGATNQLLAGLAFIVITAWLIARRKPIWFIIPPAVIMLGVPAAAMAWQAFIGDGGDNLSWVAQGKWMLVSIAALTLALEAWLIVETLLRWRRRDALRVLRIDHDEDANAI